MEESRNRLTPRIETKVPSNFDETLLQAKVFLADYEAGRPLEFTGEGWVVRLSSALVAVAGGKPTARDESASAEVFEAAWSALQHSELTEIKTVRRKLSLHDMRTFLQLVLAPHAQAAEELKRLTALNAKLVSVVMDDREGDLDFVKFQFRAALAKEPQPPASRGEANSPTLSKAGA